MKHFTGSIQDLSTLGSFRPYWYVQKIPSLLFVLLLAGTSVFAQNSVPMGTYGGSQYFCSSSTINWNSAISLANSLGGYPATVNSAGENHFLQSSVQADYAWIGLNDLQNEGVYRWSNSEPVTYLNWDNGQPNDNTDPDVQDNTIINRHNGKWQDRSGSGRYEAIIEVPIASCDNGDFKFSGSERLIKSGPTRQTFALPAVFHTIGSVDINDVITSDTYANRNNVTQRDEQIKFVFRKNGQITGQSAYTQDLQDRVVSGVLVSDLGTVSLNGGADEVIVVHKDDNGLGNPNQTDGSPNSVDITFFCLTAVPVCQNVTSGGTIAYAGGNGCGTFNPSAITNATAPTGGSGSIEYLWLSSTTSCPTNINQAIPGATSATYNPGNLSQTTFFVRCSRRAGCTDWMPGESNCIEIRVLEAPTATVTTDDADCGQNNGKITFAFADNASRTNISFSRDGGQTYPLNSADDAGTAHFNDLSAGTYPLFVRWGNNECPVDLGSVTINDGSRTPGTSCNDGNPATSNDVIQADGCTCAGTVADPCANAGGDTDGDGVCDDTDCQPNNPNFPATPGTTCSDFDANTENDVVTADGCGCAGTPVQTGGCDAINFVVDGNKITVDGISDPIFVIQLFNSNYGTDFSCDSWSNTCSLPQMIQNLAPGTYFLKVQTFNANWQMECDIWEEVTINGGGGNGPCSPDNTAPTVSNCPSNLNLTTTGNSATGTWTPPTFADACGTPAVSSNFNPGASFPVGTTTVTYTGTDAAGNSVVCSFTVRVTRGTTPTSITLTCPADVTTPQIADYGADVFIPVPNATTTCPQGGLTFSYSVTLPTNRTPHFGVGTTVVTITATDACGNTASCSYDITVTPFPATGGCDAITIVTGDGSITIDGITDPVYMIQIFTPTFATAFSCDSWSGTCSIPQLVSGLAAGDYYVKVQTFNNAWQLECDVFDLYTVGGGGTGPTCSITGTAANVACDNAGTPNNPNDDTYTFDLTVTGNGTANTWNATIAGTNFSGNYGVAKRVGPFSIAGVPNADVWLTDGGNANCAFDFTVAAPGTCSQGTTDPCANAGGDTDNDGVCNNQDCQPTNPNFPATPGSTCNDGNPNTNNDVVTADGCGCEGTPIQTGGGCDDINFVVDGNKITVNGITDPIYVIQLFDANYGTAFSCDSWSGTCTLPQMIPNLAAGTYFLKVQTFNANWQMECDIWEEVTIGGTTDPCATDTQDPVLTNCPTNITVTALQGTNCATVNFTMPTATDNCSTPTVTASTASGTCFPVGNTTVTVTATDAAGNTTTCSFRVRVNAPADPCANDTQDPTLTNCPAAITATADQGANCATVNFTMPTATDNCSTPTVTASTASGSCFAIGTTTVTVTATDAAGNTTSCTFDVTVNEPVNPTCAVRSVSNATDCGDNTPYSFYADDSGFDGLSNDTDHWITVNGTFTEFEDGTATYVGRVRNSGNSNGILDINVTFSGRTSTPPQGSPKNPFCGSVNTTNWYYYTTITGTATGRGSLAGGVLNITRRGEAFQVGIGANQQDNNEFGASGWLTLTRSRNPNNTSFTFDQTIHADFNFRLSGQPDACVAAAPVTCNSEILFVAGSTSLNASDAGIRTFLQSKGFTVTVIDDNAVTANSTNGKGAVFISATTNSSTVNTKLNHIAVPIIVAESYLFDDLKMTGTNAGHDYGNISARYQWMVAANSGNPLAAGLTGDKAVLTHNRTQAFGRPNNNATVIATTSGDSNRKSIFVYEQGAHLVDGNAAAGMRIGFFLADGGDRMTNDGKKLLEAAVRYATDCSAGNATGNLNDRNDGGNVGTAQLMNEATELAIAPNPATYFTNLTVAAPTAAQLRVFDAVGRLVETHNVTRGESTLRLETGNWNNGMYSIQLVAEGQQPMVKRLVVSH